MVVRSESGMTVVVNWVWWRESWCSRGKAVVTDGCIKIYQLSC